MLKLLTFTTLFPNPSQPTHGTFVRQRLRQIWQRRVVESMVVAPVPWYPDFLPDIPKYARYRSVPQIRQEEGVEVLHPRFPVVPRVGMTVAPILLATAVLGLLRRLYAGRFRFDLIDAHYFYPDGVAAAVIASRLRVPLVITARGTDVNLIPKHRVARAQILWAARRADQIITVSEALRDRLIHLGAAPGKITTLRNGVDPALFHPVERKPLRQALAIEGPTLLMVGHLIEIKGHHLVIEALRDLPGYNLIIVGSGEQQAALEALVEHFDLRERVRFVGEIPQARLKEYYSACDALILASSREGMPNVLLESLACGCPVVATDAGGSPEVVRSPVAGVLVPHRDAEAIATGIRKIFDCLPAREQTEKYAQQYSWTPTTDGQLEIFRSLASGGDRHTAMAESKQIDES